MLDFRFVNYLLKQVVQYNFYINVGLVEVIVDE